MEVWTNLLGMKVCWLILFKCEGACVITVTLSVGGTMAQALNKPIYDISIVRMLIRFQWKFTIEIFWLPVDISKHT